MTQEMIQDKLYMIMRREASIELQRTLLRRRVIEHPSLCRQQFAPSVRRIVPPSLAAIEAFKESGFVPLQVEQKSGATAVGGELPESLALVTPGKARIDNHALSGRQFAPGQLAQAVVGGKGRLRGVQAGSEIVVNGCRWRQPGELLAHDIGA